MTPEGAALTQELATAQLRLAAEAARDATEAVAILQVGDLDARRDDFLDLWSTVLQQRINVGTALGVEYLADYRRAEGVRGLPVITPDRIRPEVLRSQWDWVVPDIKKSIGSGMNPQEAVDRTALKVASSATVWAQAPARTVVTASAEASRSAGKSIGWRRVAGVGRMPCPFCRMLIGRGPVSTRATATMTKAGGKYHYHCYCQAVETYDHSWIYDDYEQAAADDYAQAQADGAKTPADVAKAMASRQPIQEIVPTQAAPPRLATGAGNGSGGGNRSVPPGRTPDPDPKRYTMFENNHPPAGPADIERPRPTNVKWMLEGFGHNDHRYNAPRIQDGTHVSRYPRHVTPELLEQIIEDVRLNPTRWALDPDEPDTDFHLFGRGADEPWEIQLVIRRDPHAVDDPQWTVEASWPVVDHGFNS